MLDEQPPVCPKCGSTEWRVYDEGFIQCYDEENDREYEAPLGKFVCKACGHDWIEGNC